MLLLRQIHLYDFYLIMGVSIIAGIWGLVLFFLKKGMNRAWRASLWTITALGLFQGVIGIVMITMGGKPGGGDNLYYLHYVYGAIAALGIPIALTYTSDGKNVRRDILILTVMALVIAAATVRAFATGFDV